VNRVNRLITAWPADDALPAEGLEGVKANYKRLVSGLNDIKTQSDRDVKYARVDIEHSRSCNFSCLVPFPRAIDEALERLGVLIALRKAPEATPQGTPEIYMDPWPAELIAPFPFRRNTNQTSSCPFTPTVVDTAGPGVSG